MDKKHKPSALTVRFTEEEKAIIIEIRTYYGLNSDNEALRFALRAAAREMQQLRAKALSLSSLLLAVNLSCFPS